MSLSTVGAFYEDKQVLITGGTGMVGKLLISKLLRCCPEIKRIILLLRKKNYKCANDRLEYLLKDPILQELQLDDKIFHNKIMVIEGDSSMKDFGLSSLEDWAFIQDVRIVFHCAANVRFTSDLKTQIDINLNGAIQIMRLIKKIKQLEAFVYVSSVYCNHDQKLIEEKFYQPNLNYEYVKKLVEDQSTDFLKSNHKKILGGILNGYLYSKKLAEQVIEQEGQNWPVCVFRPSLIISTFKEPIAGWTDKIFAPILLTKMLVLGFSSSVICDKNMIVDFVPADFTVNAVIVAAWQTNRRYVYSSGPLKPMIYNYVSSAKNPIKFETFLKKLQLLITKMPSSKMLWYPNLHLTSSRLMNKFHNLFRPWILCFLIDFCSLVKDQHEENKIYELSKSYGEIMDLLEALKKNPSRFSDNNVTEMWENLNTVDREIFPFDVTLFNWNVYLKVYYRGILHFILKEDNDTNGNSKIRLKRLWFIHKAVQIAIYGLLFFIVLRIIY